MKLHTRLEYHRHLEQIGIILQLLDMSRLSRERYRPLCQNYFKHTEGILSAKCLTSCMLGPARASQGPASAKGLIHVAQHLLQTYTLPVPI